MAKTPNKAKDATEEAMSAIQEALKVRDAGMKSAPARACFNTSSSFANRPSWRLTRRTPALTGSLNRLEPSWSIPFTAPPVRDRVVRAMPHEAGFKHAGGMQALGNVLAVPFETGPGSKVVFYDLSDPEQPVRLANEVDHTPLSYEAGTATLNYAVIGREIAGDWSLSQDGTGTWRSKAGDVSGTVTISRD